ncbi:MAG: hypothetical protein IPN71_21595 [Fibrobacteres bacterium]|nr:hypothetical protein [Fibrobacterota bacterium]
MTNPRQLLFVCAMLGLATAASADVIGCPSHAEKEPNWRGSSVVSGSPLAARRAAEPATHMLETAHFAIFYQTEGAHAVAGSGTNKDGNGHPDNIDSIGAIAERVWRLGVDTLGYLQPKPYDTTIGYKVLVPAGKFPIEVADIVTMVPSWGGKFYMGYADKPTSDKTGANRQSLLIENDFVDSDNNRSIQVKVDPVNTNGTDSVLIDYSKDPVKGWKVAISHEFYHNLQHRYDAVYLYGFHEMSAVWFATRCYPAVKHHWQYYPGYLKNIKVSAFETDGNGPYENFPFVTALVGALGEGVLKDLWNVHQRLFKTSEDFWLRDAFDTLKINPVPFSKLYVKSVLELVANAPNILNENGSLKVQLPIQQFPLIREIGLGAGGAQGHGVQILKLHPDQLKDGYNLLYTWSPSYSSAAFLRFPSLKADGIHPESSPIVVGKQDGDTAWLTGIMQAPYGTSYTSVEMEVTKDAVGIRHKTSPSPLAGPQYRVDLRGRPVSAGTRGIVLEGSPATGWTRSVKMGE